MKLLHKYKPVLKELNWYLNLVMLFLLSLHIGGYSSKKVILYSLFSITLFTVLNEKILLDWKVLVLIEALILYGFIYQYYFAELEYYDWWHMEDVIMPPVFAYIVCKQMVWRQNINKVQLMFLAVGGGTFIYSVLNYVTYLQEGFIDGMRYWNDFWTHTPAYATEHSYWGVFIVGLLGYGIYCFYEKKWLMGSIICFCIVVDNYVNIMVDNRMVLMVTAVVASVNIALYIFFNRKNKVKIKRIILIIAFFIAIGAVAFLFNFGGIANTTYVTHFFSRDGGILKNIRFQAMWEAIRMLPSHWKGGRTMQPAGLNAPHNYWLLVADDTGIFTFALWMIFNIAGLISMIKLIKSPKISQKVKYTVVPSLAAVVSYLMMETGGGGRSDLIIFYVIYISITNQLVENLKKSSGE